MGHVSRRGAARLQGTVRLPRRRQDGLNQPADALAPRRTDLQLGMLGPRTPRA